jgi:hypothetical protein
VKKSLMPTSINLDASKHRIAFKGGNAVMVSPQQTLNNTGLLIPAAKPDHFRWV